MSWEDAVVELVKGGLEDGVAQTPSCLGEVERVAREAAAARARARRLRAWSWSGALLAASLAVVCALPALVARMRPKPEATVARVIELLGASDGMQLASADCDSVADLLLAWQDAPYEDAISGAFGEW